MTEERFFKGLLASLAARTKYIDARDDRHQVALNEALAELRRMQAKQTPGSMTLPRTLRPGPITGKYDEFDDSLLNLQDLGYDSAQNPYYNSVELNLRPERIQSVMDRFTDDERRVLGELADVFLKSDLQQTA